MAANMAAVLQNSNKNKQIHYKFTCIWSRLIILVSIHMFRWTRNPFKGLKQLHMNFITGKSEMAADIFAEYLQKIIISATLHVKYHLTYNITHKCYH